MAATDTANDMLDKVFKDSAFSYTPVHVSLHTGDPGDNGSNEVTGGSYSRQQQSATEWNGASSGTITTNTNIDFTDMPNVTVSHVGIWDSATGGTFLWGGPLDENKNLDSGDTLRIEAGDLDATIS
jgi:hypothetical protein